MLGDAPFIAALLALALAGWDDLPEPKWPEEEA